MEAIVLDFDARLCGVIVAILAVRISCDRPAARGLGAIMGRTERENTPRLARRVCPEPKSIYDVEG